MNKGFIFSWIVIFLLELSLDYIFKFSLIITERKDFQIPFNPLWNKLRAEFAVGAAYEVY